MRRKNARPIILYRLGHTYLQLWLHCRLRGIHNWWNSISLKHPMEYLLCCGHWHRVLSGVDVSIDTEFYFFNAASAYIEPFYSNDGRHTNSCQPLLRSSPAPSEVYDAAILVVPHKIFSFAKLWQLSAVLAGCLAGCLAGSTADEPSKVRYKLRTRQLPRKSPP